MMRLQAAFSLIELLVVIAIVGVLAAAAVPVYKEYSVRAKLNTIYKAMQHYAKMEETYYGTHSRFGTATELGLPNSGLNLDTPISGTAVTQIVSDPASDISPTCRAGVMFSINSEVSLGGAGDLTGNITIYGFAVADGTIRTVSTYDIFYNNPAVESLSGNLISGAYNLHQTDARDFGNENLPVFSYNGNDLTPLELQDVAQVCASGILAQ